MRLIHYSVINKNTGKCVYANCRGYKAEEFLATLPDKENYYISHKHVSI